MRARPAVPSRILLVLAAATLPALGVALAQSRGGAEPEIAPLEDRNLVEAVEAGVASSDERVISDLETLLGRVSRRGPTGDSRNSPRDFVLEVTGEGDRIRFEPLSHAAWRLTRRLPRELKKRLVETQVAALATERSRGADDEDRLIERFPLVPDAVSWAEGLAGRAITSADELGAASFDRLALRLGTLATGQVTARSPASRLRRALALVAAHDLDGAQDELRRASRGLDPKNAADAGLLRTIGLAQRRVEAAASHRARLEGRSPPEGTVADFLASYRFSRKEAPPSLTAASPLAAHVGQTVFASDGSRVLVVDAASAELEGRLPQEDDEVAPPGTQVVGTVSTYGDLVFAPLFFEDFLLKARKNAAEAGARTTDPTVRGGFYSLFVFDARSRRLLWWDGDAGTHADDAAEDTPRTRGRPAGTGELDEAAWQRLARGHVIGKPLACGHRIYVTLATTAVEPQLWIAAYERATAEEPGLALVPVWRTFIASSLQAGPANGPPPIASSNPRLALDPDGRVLVQTDLGLAAAVDARTGALEWLVRTTEEDEPAVAPRRPARGRGPEEARSFQPTNDPPVVVPARGSHAGVLVLASLEQKRFVGLSVEDGSAVWKVDFGDVGFSYTNAESARVASLAPDVVALYGGQRVVLVDGLTGKFLSRATVTLDPGEWPSGPLARAGSRAFVLPTSGGRARVVRHVVRRGAPFDKGLDDRAEIPIEATLTLGDSFPLRQSEGPVSLVCLDERLVAVTTQTVNVYSWHKPD